MDDNAENQAIVKGLKAERVADTHGMMQEMGVGAELVNGVLKFKHTPPTPPTTTPTPAPTLTPPTTPTPAPSLTMTPSGSSGRVPDPNSLSRVGEVL